MATILLTEDRKRVAIDHKTDVCLFETPANPPNTGTRYTRGMDLYAHKSRSGNWFFYFYNWSMWDGEKSYDNLIDRESAIAFLQDRAADSGHMELSKREQEKAVEIFGDIFSENA